MVTPPGRFAQAQPSRTVLARTLPLYTYLRPLVAGRRVLELGGEAPASALHLVRLGATQVVAAGGTSAHPGGRPEVRFVPGLVPGALEAQGPFDLVLIPNGDAFFAAGAPLPWSAVRRLVAPQGFLCCSVQSGDLRQDTGYGLTYYSVVDALTPLFPVVRMFGQTPFSALGIAEFDAEDAALGLRVDSELIDPESEEPTHYLALAGAQAGPALGYALVQIDARSASEGEQGQGSEAVRAAAVSFAQSRAGLKDAARADSALVQKLAEREAEVVALARKLAETEGRADGIVRVSRAQAEELEELRARLRRAAEVRAELDEELARLRRALTQADESVMNLTRRTADEMSALAERLTQGLRPLAQVQGGGALESERAAREAALAQRESELYDRDERITALELEKQDLSWRLAAALAVEASVDSAGAGASRAAAETSAADAAEREELRHALAVRERALAEARAAAAVQARELVGVRGEVAEASALAQELEEALQDARRSEREAREEVERLRARLVELEEADRGRRRRLAEVEGQLLRLRHQAAPPAPAEPAPSAEHEAALAQARLRIADLEARLALREAELAQSRSGREHLQEHWDKAVMRLTGLERQAELDRQSIAELEQRLAARAEDPAAEEASRVRAVEREVAEQDVTRLREALERTDEELRKTRAQVLPLRDRASELEAERDARIEAELDFFRGLAREVAALEQGLRNELSEIDRVLRALDDEGRETAAGSVGDRVSGPESSS